MLNPYKIGDHYDLCFYSKKIKTMEDGTFLFFDRNVCGEMIRVDPVSFIVLGFFPWDSEGCGQSYRQAQWEIDEIARQYEND